jgi:hypothetical protein
VEVAIGFLKAKMTRYGRVMGIMQERETKFRVSRDANKESLMALDTENTINKRIIGGRTSLEAAFIDWFEAWILLITIYEALPEPWFQLN